MLEEQDIKAIAALIPESEKHTTECFDKISKHINEVNNRLSEVDDRLGESNNRLS